MKKQSKILKTPPKNNNNNDNNNKPKYYIKKIITIKRKKKAHLDLCPQGPLLESAKMNTTLWANMINSRKTGCKLAKGFSVWHTITGWCFTCHSFWAWPLLNAVPFSFSSPAGHLHYHRPAFHLPLVLGLTFAQCCTFSLFKSGRTLTLS